MELFMFIIMGMSLAWGVFWLVVTFHSIKESDYAVALAAVSLAFVLLFNAVHMIMVK